MKTIRLSRGLETVIDDEDFEWLSQWKWHAKKQPNGMFYAARYSHSKGPIIFMHRIIMGAGTDQMLDHCDRDSLNNQKSNLRFCNYSENGMNRRFNPKLNSCGFRGVRRQKWNNRFDAVLRWKKQHYYKGAFETPEEAALAYNELVRMHCSEWGVLNEL